jgi:hypothetical protein
VKGVDHTTILACARAAHEVNRAYCFARGDASQPPWEQAPSWQQESAIRGVAKALHPSTTPRDSHDAWLHDKRVDGWKYGPAKDPVAKTHPCMKPYEELSAEQRAKDELYLAVVRATAAALRKASE